MIKVWTDAAEAGLLDRYGERGSTFAYLPGAPDARAVSVTIPVRPGDTGARDRRYKIGELLAS